MLRIGWLPSFGGYLEERVRTLVNQTYYTVGEYRTYSDGIPYPYRHYFDFTLRYTRPWNGVTVGGELFAGRDVYGQSFMRFSGFVRYGGDARTRDEEPDEGDSTADSDTPERAEPWGETFVDVGGNVSRVQANLEQGLPTAQSKLQAGPHLAIGARRAVSDNNDLGVRLEYDDIETHGLLGFRAVDYRYRFSNPLALGLFAGAARYNLATPAFSIYYGGGAAWRDVIPKWDLNLEIKHAQNLARDHLLASDPQGVRAESFYKADSVVLSVARKF
jgi:hypothetical protein